ncbi:glycerate dehydrogenase [Pleomassaria siparia CBS 279.74]|uniref:Glycerate dehydrogenase n=1 Tax=Pleomassaria siparia CBS 279.74 TaxID=1314801 RepID=A0A6G1KPX8_9PLEO|nr:glycerate dehydrogenase [Pleomassaria siparia CBS 279.74]
MHHEIVALERIHQPLPDTFDFPPSTTYNLTVYDRPDAALLHSRVRDATILIVTTIKISAETLHPDVTPNLQLIALMATGTDAVDLQACRKRRIRVTNCPAANVDAVSEHAISLYFAARRKTAILDRATRQVPSDWKEKRTLTGMLRFADGQPPLSCGDEVMGVVGYGALGKAIAGLGRALGMKVLIAARKTTTPTSTSEGFDQVLSPPESTATSDDRIPFADVLRQSTVLVLSLPRNPQTINLLSTAEFAAMSPHTVLVNIARGGIVDETAVIQALKDGQIAGYATDVLEKEPAEGPEDSPLLGQEAAELNITLSPHLAWFAQRTIKNLAAILKSTVEAWVQGKEINVIA